MIKFATFRHPIATSQRILFVTRRVAVRPRYKQPRLRSRPRVRKKAIASQHTERLVLNEHSIVGYLSPPPPSG